MTSNGAYRASVASSSFPPHFRIFFWSIQHVKKKKRKILLFGCCCWYSGQQRLFFLAGFRGRWTKSFGRNNIPVRRISNPSAFSHNNNNIVFVLQLKGSCDVVAAIVLQVYQKGWNFCLAGRPAQTREKQTQFAFWLGEIKHNGRWADSVKYCAAGLVLYTYTCNGQ